LVAVAIGVTVPDPESVTYTVLPSGVIASAHGAVPIWMGRPVLPVRALIGVTVSPRLSAT